MESRHCGQDKGIFFCPVHNASTPCSLQAFGIRCIDSVVYLSISFHCAVVSATTPPDLIGFNPETKGTFLERRHIIAQLFAIQRIK